MYRIVDLVLIELPGHTDYEAQPFLVSYWQSMPPTEVSEASVYKM